MKIFLDIILLVIVVCLVVENVKVYFDTKKLEKDTYEILSYCYHIEIQKMLREKFNHDTD